MSTTAILCITGWTVICAVLLRANHRAHRKPTPEPTPWFVTTGFWDYPLEPDPIDLADQPVDVWLTDEVADRLFDELMAIEGFEGGTR